MIVCPSSFVQSPPDSADSDIALHELDIYAASPQSSSYHDHRLSIRYRFSTEEFEVYRHYSDGRTDGVVFSGSFHEALESANLEHERQWGEGRGRDIECEHSGQYKAHSCRVDQD